jgi:predicted ATPase/class 3 adenylate cyclase
MAELPTGTVTFLFTDVEGSTRLLHELGDGYAEVLAEHRRVLRDAFARHGGVEVDTQGDAFFVAFRKASDALAAAAAGRDALSAGPIRVRMGLHTGEPVVTAEGYVGIDVHRAARIAAAGHGGQILVSKSTRDLSRADSLRDLGDHRLKDLTAPERIYQLGDGDFPPLKTLNATNLPIAASALVGRRRELEELEAMLRDGARAVTLTGPGGSGKTRLGLQVAADLLDDFPGGVYFVPLAGVAEPELVEATIAATIGVRQLGELRSGSLLLIDNFEHVLDAAPVVGRLLAASPETKVLTTSRAPLRIAGELEYPLDVLPASEALALLTERARAVRPDFQPDEAAREICAKLDRLPLALELAAPRLRSLDSAALLERLEQRLPVLTGGLRDAPERQQTLRATIEWSYSLLTTRLQALFARLGVFAGTFSLAAAESVADADYDDVDALVEASLLKPVRGGRFLMLETLREYAIGSLEGRRQLDEFRARHLEYVLQFVVKTEPELAGPQQDDLFAELALENDNIREALAFACESGDSERAMMLAGSNWRFWHRRAQIVEALQWYERAFALGGDVSTRARARATYGRSEMERNRGNFDRSLPLLEEAIGLLRAAGEDRWLISAMNHLASVHLDVGETTTARRLYEETLQLARQHDNRRAVSIVTGNLGYLAIVDGRDDEAEALLMEALELERDGAGIAGVADALINLALLSLRRGDVARAAESVAEAVQRLHSVASEVGLFEGLLLAAVAIGRSVDPRIGVRLQAATRFLAAERTYKPSAGELELADAALEEARAALGGVTFADEWSRGEQLDLDAAVATALQSLD